MTRCMKKNHQNGRFRNCRYPHLERLGGGKDLGKQCGDSGCASKHGFNETTESQGQGDDAKSLKESKKKIQYQIFRKDNKGTGRKEMKCKFMCFHWAMSSSERWTIIFGTESRESRVVIKSQSEKRSRKSIQQMAFRA